MKVGARPRPTQEEKRRLKEQEAAAAAASGKDAGGGDATTAAASAVAAQSAPARSLVSESAARAQFRGERDARESSTVQESRRIPTLARSALRPPPHPTTPGAKGRELNQGPGFSPDLAIPSTWVTTGDGCCSVGVSKTTRARSSPMEFSSIIRASGSLARF